MTWHDVLKEGTKALVAEIQADRAAAKHYHIILGTLSNIPSFEEDVQEVLYQGAELVGGPCCAKHYIIQAYLI